MHHLHDQGVDSVTGSEPITKHEANPRRVAPTFAVTFAFALTNLIALTWHDRRHAFAQWIARGRAAGRHR